MAKFSSIQTITDSIILLVPNLKNSMDLLHQPYNEIHTGA
jgi:hypothetical protein